MKKCLAFLFVCLTILFLSNSASAVPLDLSTFTTETGFTGGGSVVLSGDVVTFTEDADSLVMYFYDDNFFVPTNATILSLDFTLTLGADNEDYLVAVIDYTNYVMEIGQENTSSDPIVLPGLYSIDLSSYQGATISLEFGLEASDDYADTVATISNLDLATTSTVIPEPGTIILLGVGLIYLLGIKRRKISFM